MNGAFDQLAQTGNPEAVRDIGGIRPVTLGLAFIDEVSRLIWAGKVDGWHQGTHLADATARAGLELAELDVNAEKESDRLDAAIAQNQQDLEAAGHWGVPTMVFEGEPFFGQDRIDLLTWRMEQRGLRRR